VGDRIKELGEMLGWLHSDAGAAAFAGAAGGLVRWLTLRESWRDGLLSLVVGSVCAIYLGPIVEPLLEPWIGRISPGKDASGFSSFVVGIGGIGIAGILIDIMKSFAGRLRAGKGNPGTPSDPDRHGGGFPPYGPYQGRPYDDRRGDDYPGQGGGDYGS